VYGGIGSRCVLSNIHIVELRFNDLNFFFIKMIKDTGKERALRIA
jgi:hypothetical protein